MYPSAKVKLEYLLDFVPPIKPRLYSIASAPEMHPNHIELCITENDWNNSRGDIRRGQSTWFMRNQKVGSEWGQLKAIRDDAEEPLGILDKKEAPLVPVRVNPA